MEKNTLSNYGLILVAVLIVSAMLVVFSPISPFGFSDSIRTAFNDAVDKYINKTNIDVVVPEDDNPVDIENPQDTFCFITIKHILESGQEVTTEKVKVSYGSTFTFADQCLSETETPGYKVGAFPSSKIIVKDEVFTITYVPKTYTITYNTNGGTILSTATTSYQIGHSVTYPKNLTRPGYTFLGWYETADFSGSVVYELPINSYRNIVLYARWTNVPLKISYYIDGERDTTLMPNTMVYGDTNQLTLPVPQKDGVVFDGWYATSNYTGTKYSKTPANPTDDITFYARWTNKAKCTIQYVLNGGSFTSTQGVVFECVQGTKFSLPTSSQLSHRGYIFEGWYLDRNLKNRAGDQVTGSSDSLSLYAKWTPETYSIVYDTESGVVSNPFNSYNITETPKTLPQPTKPGYEFKGWVPLTRPNELWFEIPENTVGDIRLSASWKPIIYNLTFNPKGLNDAYAGYTSLGLNSAKVNGSNTLTLKIPYNSVYDIDDITATYGYHDFLCWEDAQGNEITSGTIFENTQDTVLYAKFAKKIYPVEYVFIDNGTGNEISYNTDDCFTLIDGEKEVNIAKSTYPLLNHALNLPNVISFDEKFNANMFVFDADFKYKYEVINETDNPWYFNKNNPRDSICDANSIGINAIGNDGTARVYCKVKPASCNYYYNLDSGTMNGVVSSGTYSYGSEFALPTPTRTGYNFAGWAIISSAFTNEDGSALQFAMVEYNEAGMKLPSFVYGPIQIKAVWEKIQVSVPVKVYLKYNNQLVSKNGENVYADINVVLDEEYSNTDMFDSGAFFGNAGVLDFADEYYIPTTYKNVTFVNGDSAGGKLGFVGSNDTYTAYVSYKNDSYYINIDVERYYRFKLHLVSGDDNNFTEIPLSEFENPNLDTIQTDNNIIKFKEPMENEFGFTLPTSSTAYMYEGGTKSIYWLTKYNSSFKSTHKYKINETIIWLEPSSFTYGNLTTRYNISASGLSNAEDIDLYIKYSTDTIGSFTGTDLALGYIEYGDPLIYNGTGDAFTKQSFNKSVLKSATNIVYSPNGKSLPCCFTKFVTAALPPVYSSCDYKFVGWLYNPYLSTTTYNIATTTEVLPTFRNNHTLYPLFVICADDEKSHSYSEFEQKGCAFIQSCEYCSHKDVIYVHAWSEISEEIITVDNNPRIVTKKACDLCSATQKITSPVFNEHECLHGFSDPKTTTSTTNGQKMEQETMTCIGCMCGEESCKFKDAGCGATRVIEQPVIS